VMRRSVRSWGGMLVEDSGRDGEFNATHNSGLVVKRAVQYIHSDDMLGLVVPWAVLAPVVGGHFFP
jgi:hypothetical protein